MTNIILDPEYEHLRKFCSLHSAGYVNLDCGEGQILLHRFLMQADSATIVDHKNHNKLDNRLENLRLCTYTENRINTGKRKGHLTTSKYKGVYFQGQGRKKPWWAYIKNEGVRHSLGYYLTQEEAAERYNKAAKEMHGEFAVLNVIVLE